MLVYQTIGYINILLLKVHQQGGHDVWAISDPGDCSHITQQLFNQLTNWSQVASTPNRSVCSFIQPNQPGHVQ